MLLTPVISKTENLPQNLKVAEALETQILWARYQGRLQRDLQSYVYIDGERWPVEAGIGALALEAHRVIAPWDNFLRNPSLNELKLFLSLNQFLDTKDIKWERDPGIWEKAWSASALYHTFACGLIGYLLALSLQRHLRMERRWESAAIDPLTVAMTALVHEAGRYFGNHRFEHDVHGRLFAEHLGLGHYFPSAVEGQHAYSEIGPKPPMLEEDFNLGLFVLADTFGKMQHDAGRYTITLPQPLKERAVVERGSSPPRTFRVPADGFLLVVGPYIANNFANYLEALDESLQRLGFDVVGEVEAIRKSLTQTNIDLVQWVLPENRSVIEQAHVNERK